MSSTARCPYCQHAMVSHYAGVPPTDRPEDGVYRCHWVDGVPGGRCDCARPIKGWTIYGEPERT